MIKNKGVTVNKSAVHIAINFAGNHKNMGFSNSTVAQAFIKGASAKFGDKFKVISSVTITLKPGDYVSWRIHQFSPETRVGVVTDVLPPEGDSLVFDAKMDDGKDVWGYMGLIFEINDEKVKPSNPERAEFEVISDEVTNLAPQQDANNNAPITSGQSDIDGGAPSFKEGSKQAGFNLFFPGQVLEHFYPEIQHEIVEYPNATNSPMPADLTGDSHEVPSSNEGNTDLPMDEPELLPGAIEDAFEGMTRISYVSTSPAGGMGIGRDGKTQVLEGTPLRKEDDIRGPMFLEEFNAQYEGIPGGALSVVGTKVAAAEEKQQFASFLKRVMGEVVATFLAAFKVTNRTPLNKIPGVGELKLDQVEQPTLSTFNIVNQGSRVKYLVEKLTDSEVQDCINGAFAQGAIWCDDKDNREGSYVYECFARAETLDPENLTLKYKFLTGTKEAE